MSQPMLFDDSFEALLDEVRRVLGDEALDKTVVHREAAGRLAFFYDGELPSDKTEALEKALRERLGPYARPDRLVADRREPAVERMLDETPRQWLPPHGDRRIRYVDRRIVGVDWLAGPPTDEEPASPRFVFASLKGGVGRTTALCVAATDLARHGKNILVVDLDLEAPGVGSLLLGEDDAPRLGSIDYLVESTVVEPDRLSLLIPHLVAPSFHTRPEGGRIDVVPAFGSATKPENYLGKLARALLDVGPDGTVLPVRMKISRLLDALTSGHSYDAVVIDARAGLGELAAGPLLGLGATVLLFGTAQRQTLQDYRLLFAHLASMVEPAPEAGSPWDTLRVVLAKAAPDARQNQWFLEELYALFQEYLYEEQEGLEGFNFREDDPAAPHYPVPIAMNPLFADWDPTRRPDDLTQPFYESSFRPFLDDLYRRIETDG
jgi:CobQ/CobB/MinD/ParA nucleotide binding domain